MEESYISLLSLGHSNFYITKTGNLFKRKGRLLCKVKLFNDKDGYLVTAIQSNGARTSIKIHRVVAMVFLNASVNGKEINHKDGNKENNCVENLEIVTHKENMLHAKVKKLLSMGEGKRGATIDNIEAITIKTLIRSGWSTKKISREYNVPNYIVNSIKTGRTWASV